MGIISALCFQFVPVARGKIQDKRVMVLQDTGCTSVLVKREFVNEGHYTGMYTALKRVDNSMKDVLTTPTNVLVQLITQGGRSCVYP